MPHSAKVRIMLIIKELDDGQVIKDELSNLTQHQIISVANQFLREGKENCTGYWRILMQYQHQKYHKDSQPTAA